MGSGIAESIHRAWYWLLRHWAGLVVGYTILLVAVFFAVWAVLEPFGVPAIISSAGYLRLVQQRIFLHCVLTLLAASHLMLLLELFFRRRTWVSYKVWSLPGQASWLMKRISQRLEELPQIRDLYLDHPDVRRWRGATRRLLQDIDAVFPEYDFVGQYDEIAWHPSPSDPSADDSQLQRDTFIRACNTVEGLLGDAQLMLQEQLEALEEKRASPGGGMGE